MPTDRSVLKAVEHALSGKGAHVATAGLFEGLSWKAAGARPEGASHSVFQVLNHMSFWQDWVVGWLAGQAPPVPRHASGGWPGDTAPANAAEWQRAVRRFRKGLQAMTRGAREVGLLTRHGARTRLEMLQSIAAHNSYHAGQVVVLRQMQGAWPPPSGGLTW